MTDPFEDEMDKRQKLLVEKLAEIGVTVQMPISFGKMPNGPVGGQLAFVWEDSSHVQIAAADDDAFMQIMMAEKEAEAVAREQQRKEAEAEAREELMRLAEGGFLDDDDDDD